MGKDFVTPRVQILISHTVCSRADLSNQNEQIHADTTVSTLSLLVTLKHCRVPIHLNPERITLWIKSIEVSDQSKLFLQLHDSHLRASRKR